MSTPVERAYPAAPAAMASALYAGGPGRDQASAATVRSFFGLAGSGLPKSSADDPENDGTVEGVVRTALQDSLAVTCLYAIVVCGRGITTPGAMSVFKHSDFWVWLALLVLCNTFLQVFYPTMKQQLVQASVFTVVLVLMSPIKTPELVSAGDGS